jgi:hypothetical protein
MKTLNLIVLVILLQNFALAQFSSTSLNTSSSKGPRYNNTIHFGLEVGSWEYIEVDSKSNDRLMSDSGNLYGLSFKSNHQLASQLVFLSRARLLGGNTTYDGYLQNDEGKVLSPYKSDSRNFLGNAHLALGVNLSSSENFAFTPNIGVSRRILLNPQLDSDPYDYTRMATYDTFPLALDVFFKADRDLAFTLNATTHLGFKGKTIAYSSGNDGGDRTYEQDKGKGQEFSAGSEFKLEGNNVAYINLQYKTWEVEDSKIESESDGIYSLEPKNSTKEIGLNLGVTF